MAKRNHIKDVLWALVFAWIAAAVVRFFYGLGTTTNLNDTIPWGLWIAFKLAFVALAGGGFTLAGMVYVFHLKTYRPLLRAAILLALLGYGSFIVSLIFDLGLPWHIYMPVIHWQHHSVMFEIAWCVILYFSVLVMEISPLVLEHPLFQRWLFQKVYHFLHRATVPLVIAGIVLSTLHQSSLGALFLIMPHRVHPLWYSPLIPVLFFVSAIVAGLMALIIERFLAARWFGHDNPMHLLTRISKIAAFMLWLYLAIRLADLFWRGVLPSALDGSWQSMIFIVEILLGGVLPAALLLIPLIRQSRRGLVTCSLLAIAGIVSQRMSLSLFTMHYPEGSSYFPSGYEGIIALGIPAAAGLLYFFMNENIFAPVTQIPAPYTLPIFDPITQIHQETSARSMFLRRSAIAVVVIALTFAILPSDLAAGQSMQRVPVEPALGWRYMLVDGNQSAWKAYFPHLDHQERLQRDLPNQAQACDTCHHISKPGDEVTGCWECHRDQYLPGSIFDHNHHQTVLGGNRSCQECHAGEHVRDDTIPCTDCHEAWTSVPGDASFDGMAPGYQDAMHGTCLRCHEGSSQDLDQQHLALCPTCHNSQVQDSQDRLPELLNSK